jgi:hypothetical protein
MKVEQKEYENYLNGLTEIMQRIEVANKEGNTKKVAEWFQYLQGYVKAWEVLKNPPIRSKK